MGDQTTVANIQGGTSKDVTQEPVVPNHQMTPEIGSSSQGPQNNLANFSIQQNDLSSLLEAILDESDIEESIMRSNLVANQLEPNARSERGKNNGGENDQRRLGGQTKTIGSNSSVFRGVVKCHDRRFEAFAWDNSGKGRIVYIGAFSNEIDAARAHDMVSIKISGLHTLINFPGRSYWREIDFMRNMSKKEYVDNVRGRGKEYTPEGECPFRGVVYRSQAREQDSRKWEARLGRKGMPTINLGVYYTQEDAARAYDIISIKLKGWKAITNFDITGYEVKHIMESVIIQDADGSVVLEKPEINYEIEANPQTNSPVQHNVPQQLSNSSSSHGFQNPNLILSNPGTFQAYPQNNFLGQHNPQQLTNSSSSNGLQNSNLIPNNPGTQAYAQSSSLGQHTPQQLTNSSFSLGCQNPNLIPSGSGFQAYPQSSSLGQHNTLGGFTLGAGSSSGYSIPNFGGEFPNQNATLQQYSLQTQNQVNVNNNNFIQNLLNNNSNNQFLPHTSNSNLPFHTNVNQNLGLENSLHFPDFPFDFGKNLLGEETEFQSLSTLSALYDRSALATGMVNGSTGATNVSSSSVSEILPVSPSTQEFGAAQPQLPELNQSYEPHNFQANTLNQNPHQNLNSSFFSGGFQNPSSQPNNTGSQSHAIHGSQIGLGMTDLLNSSYNEDNNFSSDFDHFFEQ